MQSFAKCHHHLMLASIPCTIDIWSDKLEHSFQEKWRTKSSLQKLTILKSILRSNSSSDYYIENSESLFLYPKTPSLSSGQQKVIIVWRTCSCFTYRDPQSYSAKENSINLACSSVYPMYPRIVQA